jgi:hypothetical protein
VVGVLLGATRPEVVERWLAAQRLPVGNEAEVEELAGEWACPAGSVIAPLHDAKMNHPTVKTSGTGETAALGGRVWACLCKRFHTGGIGSIP